MTPRLVVSHHRMMSELGTTLLWKHMNRLMDRRKTFEFPGSVCSAFMTGKRLVLNGRRVHDVDTGITTPSTRMLYKVGNAIIEYDRYTNQSMVYSDDDMVSFSGHAYPNVNKISFAHAHYYDTLEAVNEYSYDPKIHMYIHVYDGGFSVVSSNSRDISPEDMIVRMDRGELNDSCYFQCDNQLFAFCETMRYVSYVYRNTLYVGETTYPFRLFASEKLPMKDIVSITMTGMSPVIAHDTNRVTIFNYLRK